MAVDVRGPAVVREEEGVDPGNERGEDRRRETSTPSQEAQVKSQRETNTRDTRRTIT